MPDAESHAHDYCRDGCGGEPVQWNERTGHWYCANGNDACPLPPAETRAESNPRATNGRVSTAQTADGDSA